MKHVNTFLILLFFGFSAHAQIFPVEIETTWEFKDESQKVIVITYDLQDFEELRYLKVMAKAFVDERLVPMRSIRGDIGEAVKVGKNKQIEWSWENDVVELAGELSFVVTADNPNPVTEETTTDSPEMEKPAIPIVKVLALPVAAGGGLILTGLLSSSSAKSDWNALGASDRTQDQYDELNGKYKTGNWLAIGGAVVIGAGIIWFIKEKAALNSYSSRITVEPAIGELTIIKPQQNVKHAPIGLSLNYNF